MRASEIAKLMGISKDTLRFYEREALISIPERGDNNYRRYTAEHVKQIKFIKYAQSAGFTLS
uniref:MerR family transcriptional regulator n=1 Tax=Ningiella ruwaisensis TaxID=2364274 RepID=UPI00109F1325|nr:MerR family transcriptional regulator [Ningiella ruwaisensis]